MLKKLIVSTVFLASLSFAGNVMAENEQICTTVYGGGVVCGASTEHEPIDTAISVHPAVVGAGLLGLSRVFGLISKKIKNSSYLE